MPSSSPPLVPPPPRRTSERRTRSGEALREPPRARVGEAFRLPSSRLPFCSLSGLRASAGAACQFGARVGFVGGRGRQRPSAACKCGLRPPWSRQEGQQGVEVCARHVHGIVHEHGMCTAARDFRPAAAPRHPPPRPPPRRRSMFGRFVGRVPRPRETSKNRQLAPPTRCLVPARVEAAAAAATGAGSAAEAEAEASRAEASSKVAAVAVASRAATAAKNCGAAAPPLRALRRGPAIRSPAPAPRPAKPPTSDRPAPVYA